MATYVITYDLQGGTSEDYAELHSAIRDYGVWAHITESTWSVVTDQTATELRDALTAFLKPGDRLFVIKSGGAAAWRNVRCKSEWLKRHL